MAVLTLLTLISLITGNSGDILRPTVSCSPWNHIYSGDSVTLQCDIGQNKNIDDYYFYWYKDNLQLSHQNHKFTIQNANSYDTGVYECWSGSGERSHPLSLYVIYKDKNRPSVTFSPNYRSIFSGETMEMSCVLGSSTSRYPDYVWYKEKERITEGKNYIKAQKYIIPRATSNDEGSYRCERGRGASYPERLDVYLRYQHKVILQTPPDIVEGDSLDMRCHSSPDHNEEEHTTFYKDGAIIQSSGHILHLPNVKKSMSGIYRCEKTFPNEGLLKTEETFVFVQDLFTNPKIKAPSKIKEGDTMTVTCDTRRNPLRENTELLFIFYRNGQIVQKISSSSTYRIRPAQLKDSGNYTCEVRTPSDTVIKMGETSYISITELFKRPELQIHPEMVQEGDKVMMKCEHSLRSTYIKIYSVTFYKDSQSVQYRRNIDEYVIYAASEEHTGNYKCSLLHEGIRKNSSEIKVLVHAAVNKPHLMLSPNMAAVGDDIVLRCESSKGSIPIYYQFYHSHKLLGNITVHQKEAAELPVTITSLTMGGSYYCASYNDLQTQPQHSDEASVLVMEPVANITITTDKEGEDFELGESLTFNCSVQRGTSISFFWLHNETMVEQRSEIYHLQDDGKVLYIPSLQYHHEGTYRCHANNELSANRTFSVQSEIRKVHILELSSIGRSIQWVMLGILLLLIILAVGLIFTYWDKIVSAGRCKKPPPTDTQQNNEDVDKPNTTPETEVVYENFRQQENIYEEDEGYTYITVRAVQAPPSCPAAATRENVTVLYSTVRSSGETIQIDPGEETPETSGSTCIYHTVTAENITDPH